MLDLIQSSVLYISTIAEIGIIAAVFKKRIAKECSLLLAYEFLQIINSAFLDYLYEKKIEHAYAVEYWLATHFFTLIQISILLQIGYFLFSWIRSRRTLVVMALGSITLAICIGSAMASIAPNVIRKPFDAMMLNIDRTCMFTWCIMLVLLTLGSQIPGLRWTRIEASITVAFGAMSLSEVICVEVIGRLGHKVWPWALTLNSATYMFATLFLMFALFQYRPSPSSDVKKDLEELKIGLSALQSELAEYKRV
jgi:hypothetical protein